MASRSAMTRFLVVAAVVLAVVHSASAANIVNMYKVSIQLQGTASDYLQVAKRNQFCTSFGAVVATGTAPTPADLTGCAIQSAVNGATSGEVTVTAAFTFTTARANAATTEVVGPLNTALNSATPPTGFVKAASAGSTPVAGAGTQGIFPSYFLEVEIPTTTAADPATYGPELLTKLNNPNAVVLATTGVSCTGSAITPTANPAATKLVCRLRSRTKTRSEMLTAVETAVKEGVTVGGATITGLYARDTGVQQPGLNAAGIAEKFVIDVEAVISNQTPTELTTNQGNLRSALGAAIGNIVVDTATDITFADIVASGSGSKVKITIRVASEASANRVLEVVKQLLGSSIGTTPTFAISSINSLTSDPPLFSGTLDTVYPGRVYRYSIVVTNTTSAFTTAPYQFRRVCEAITSTMQGNATTCAIVSFERPSGDSGTLIVDITAFNDSAALGLSRSVVRAVAAVPATTFVLGAVSEQLPTSSSSQHEFIAGSVVLILSAPTSAEAVTAAMRTDICSQLTGNGWVPASAINCFISESDVVAGSAANTVKVTARVWWNLIDYSVEDFVKALNRAKTSTSLPTISTVTYTATDFAAGPTAPPPATFVFDIDFHITVEQAAFDTSANRATFASAIRSIIGNNAVVSVAKAVTASPSTGTIVTVRVFTPNAVAQGDAYEALAPQIAGSNTTIAAPTATYTLQTGGFRAVRFNPAVAVTEFPSVPAPPPPATPPNRPASPPATSPPALPPQAPISIPQDPTQDPTSVVRTFVIEIQGTSNEAAARILMQKLVDYINQRFPGMIASFTLSSFSNLGKKFVTQNYRFTISFVASTAANAAVLNSRIAEAINNGAIPEARVVSFILTPATTTNPTTPAAPTAPAAPPAPVTMTTGTIDITILGTRSSFTQTDQTALTSNIASAINGTASVINIAETSAGARKFTMQASALRLTTSVSAPASQYPTLDSIIARLNAVKTSQQGRLGNSAVSTITASQAGAATRSGPVAVTILVALVVAMLSAMAQF